MFGRLDTRRTLVEVEASLVGQLRTGYGNLGSDITETEAGELLTEVLTPDSESETGYKYLGVPGPDEPATCGDGRPGKMGLLRRLRYKMFGGDAQVNWEAQELAGGFQLQTIKSENPDAGPIERARDFMEKVVAGAHGRVVGAHISGDHAHGPNCGCGAIDNHTKSLDTIIKEYESGSDELVTLTSAAMTEEFDADFHGDTVAPNARRLAGEERKVEYNGSAFLDAVRSLEAGGKASIEDLEGDHAETLFIVNLTDFTLDRDSFVTDTGKQVFWIDEPAIRSEAGRYGKDETEARHLYQAAMTAQVAKAKALCKEGMRIAVLRPAT